ncbi:MAG: M20 family metallopeptidase [Ruminococcus sp.]|nr:M20 family metallopeptidase [Ruminococcus sp.]
MQYQKEIHEYLENHKSEMLDLLGKLVAVRSVQGEAGENMPFGSEPAKALKIMLDACQESGFQIENLDNYAGSADLNEKKPELGILAHLDVVPEGDGWTHDPYQMTYDPDSDKLFGRGTSDDKGPAVASLFAMKAVHDLQIPMKSGVRLIFGTNEENGSEDLEYYMKHRTLPPMVFTPDGDYPVINLEKGMCRLKLSAEFTDGNSKILKLDAGNVINAVPAQASAVLTDSSPETVQQVVHDLQKCYPVTIPETEIAFDNNLVTVSVNGESAHASTPEKGRNALTFLLEILDSLHLKGQQGEILHKLFVSFPYGETDGKSLGISAEDELSGGLTCVLSVMQMDKNQLTAYADIRFPVCCTGAEIISRMQKTLAPVTVEAILCDEPHHTDENSPFVQTLLNVYESVTGNKGECLAIGGGTYVHHIEGGVAFGATFPDTDVHMHGAEEFIKLEHFLLDAEMMALAITELCAE